MTTPVVLKPHWEVVTDGPVSPGALAHRYGSHHWKTTKTVYGREEVTSHSAHVPACQRPEPGQPPSTDGRAYSAGWAQHRGAVACTAAQCFAEPEPQPEREQEAEQ